MPPNTYHSFFPVHHFVCTHIHNPKTTGHMSVLHIERLLYYQGIPCVTHGHSLTQHCCVYTVSLYSMYMYSMYMYSIHVHCHLVHNYSPVAGLQNHTQCLYMYLMTVLHVHCTVCTYSILYLMTVLHCTCACTYAPTLYTLESHFQLQRMLQIHVHVQV